MPDRLTIQVPPETHSRLRQLAEERHESMADTVMWLMNREEETRFWDAFNAGYGALRSDRAAWNEEQSERSLWDTTLRDTLDHA